MIGNILTKQLSRTLYTDTSVQFYLKVMLCPGLFTYYISYFIIIVQGNVNQSLNNETPSTIVKCPNKLLPREKQPFPDCTIQHSVAPEKKHQTNDEVKCIYIKNEYITNDVRESRVSNSYFDIITEQFIAFIM